MDARTVPVPGPMLIGSGVALYFSALCNAYLNVEDGGFFGVQLFWLAVVGTGHFIGVLQQGSPNSWSKYLSRVGMGVAFVMLIPYLMIYQPLRAIIFFLVLLQSARVVNISGKREIYFSLMASFLSIYITVADFRADWTMSFFALPAFFAILFTLSYEVADQYRRNESATSVLGPMAVSAIASVLIGLAAALTIIRTQKEEKAAKSGMAARPMQKKIAPPVCRRAGRANRGQDLVVLVAAGPRACAAWRPRCRVQWTKKDCPIPSAR